LDETKLAFSLFVETKLRSEIFSCWLKMLVERERELRITAHEFLVAQFLD